MNKYIKHDNYYEVVVEGNKNDGSFLIDLDDYERVKQHPWYIKDSTNTNPRGYICAKINKKSVKLHRFIMNVTDRKDVVDHIDKDPWNNRKSNLRIVNSSTNNLNVSFSKNNTSGRTGVKYITPKNGRSPKWVAQVNIDGKRKSKDFAISVYGESGAYERAVKQREEWEKEYNITTERERSTTIETDNKGVEYTDNGGNGSR